MSELYRQQWFIEVLQKIAQTPPQSERTYALSALQAQQLEKLDMGDRQMVNLWGNPYLYEYHDAPGYGQITLKSLRDYEGEME